MACVNARLRPRCSSSALGRLDRLRRARHLPTDAAQGATRLARAIPFSLGAFFRDYYDRRMLRLNHTETRFDPAEIWRREDFLKDLQAIAEDGRIATPNTVKSYPPSGKPKYSVPKGTSPEEAAKLIEAKMSEGHSFVLAYEHVSPALRPLRWLSDALFDLTGVPASIHLSAPPGRAGCHPHRPATCWSGSSSAQVDARVRAARGDGERLVQHDGAALRLAAASSRAREQHRGAQPTVDDALDCEHVEPGDVLTCRAWCTTPTPRTPRPSTSRSASTASTCGGSSLLYMIVTQATRRRQHEPGDAEVDPAATPTRSRRPTAKRAARCGCGTTGSGKRAGA